jgi:tetratricopeptide (TPR) repeat protein
MNVEAQKHLEYASGYFDLKMYDEALIEVDAALAIVPDHPVATGVKSDILWRMNRLNEVEPFLAKMAEWHPNDSDIWINLAYIRRRTQSLEAAAETLKRAFAVNPRNALAHFNMACYRAAQHRTAEALALLKNAVHLNPKLKELAKAEPDFATVRDLPEFQELVKLGKPAKSA